MVRSLLLWDHSTRHVHNLHCKVIRKVSDYRVTKITKSYFYWSKVMGYVSLLNYPSDHDLNVKIYLIGMCEIMFFC